jgi:ribonuclease III
MPGPDLEALQGRLGYRFKDASALQRALTHRSFGADHNERLEFLGDAVLNLAISNLLYARLGAGDEGLLSRTRALLVREDTLHQVALELGLPPCLRLSEGEARSGGAQRPSILADAVEALLGAVHLDAGYTAAEAVVVRLLGPHVQDATARRSTKDAKTALQEWLQGRRLPTPAYRIAAVHGQAHAQTFEVNCEVPELGLSAVGQGRSRRAAEQEAATRLLALLPASNSPLITPNPALNPTASA